MKTWREPDPIAIPEGLQLAVGGHVLVTEVLLRRGFTDLETIQAFLDPGLYSPASPFELGGVPEAVDRIAKAIQGGESICVWGDFDVDGQTSTTLLVSTLQELGANVTFHIPIREVESHGVNLPVLKEKIGRGMDVLLTCDTGISAHEAVAHANSRGVDVIISDHHDPPAALPEALAVIDPKLGPPDHPLADLPGVGVAYKLAEALNDRLGRIRAADTHLDLIALGIVADLAYQTKDVRYLLQRGLAALRRTERLGLQIMMELAELDPAGLTEEHIGFELGPRLNALGRLDDANQAVELMTTTSRSRGKILANRLEGLNAQRKLLTSQVFQAAQSQLERDASLLDHAALVLSHDAWPGGVIGIVASRLVERYDRPALLITSPSGELARGSARSIPGVNISAAIAAQRSMLASFGGHPMAAGFALQRDRIPEFRQAVSETVAEMISQAQMEPALDIEGYLPLSDLTLELVADLERMAPFGTGNPNPVLVSRNLQLESRRPLGRTGEHLQMILEDDQGEIYKTVWWGGGIGELPEWLKSGTVFDLAYTARSSDFKGQEELQIEWLDAHPVENGPIEVLSKPREMQIIDHRGLKQPLLLLKEIIAGPGVIIWAEGEAQSKLSEHGIDSLHRYALSPEKRLVIWTSPPGSHELRKALDAVDPELVHLFAVDPGMDRLESFFKRLGGLVKYALNKNQGQTSIKALAAGTAQQEVTVKMGLEWLASQGHLKVLSNDDGELSLAEGERDDRSGTDDLAGKLKSMLAETAAFRSYYARAEAGHLITPT